MEIMRRKTFIQCQDTPKTHFEHHVLSFKLPYWHSCYKTFNCSKYIYWFKNVYPECFPYFLDLQGIQKKKKCTSQGTEITKYTTKQKQTSKEQVTVCEARTCSRLSSNSLCAATEIQSQRLGGLTHLPVLSSLTVFSSVGSTSGVFSTRLWCSGASLDLKPQ